MMNYIKDFFLLNLKDYQNIGIDFPIGIFLISITIAFCISAFVIDHYKKTTSNLIKQLTRHGAKDEASAKTLSELRIKNNYTLRRALSGNGQFKDIVLRVGQTNETYEEYIARTKGKKNKEIKPDFVNARFFLNTDKEDIAKRIYENDNSGIIRPILMSAMLVAILICLVFFLPELLTLINNSLSS